MKKVSTEIFAEVIESGKVGSYRYLDVKFHLKGFSCSAGQFAMLSVGKGLDPLLRRPLSIWKWESRGEEHVLGFYYKVVGRGTEILSSYVKGDVLSIAAPLGRGFFQDPSRRLKLLVSGGAGRPPIEFLAEDLIDKGVSIEWFHGERTADDHSPTRLEGVSFHAASDAGGEGMFRGTSVDAFVKWWEENNPDPLGVEMFACGPVSMLKAVADFALSNGIRLEVSLENRMACGRGVCLGCVVPAANGGWLRVCNEGPVFDIAEVRL